MLKGNGRHRGEWRLLKYPIPIYWHTLKNRWFFFWKPDLLKWCKNFQIKVMDLLSKRI